MAQVEPEDKYSITDGDDRDDEAAFWDGFFERLKPLKETFDGAREGFAGSFVGEGLDTMAQLADDIGDAAEATTRRTAELTYSSILRSPAAVAILLLLVTASMYGYAEKFEHQINGDVEIYLPDGADSTAVSYTHLTLPTKA